MKRRMFVLVAVAVLLSLGGGTLSAASLNLGIVGEEVEMMDKRKQQGEKKT